ncbi:uncharacterized protein LOC121857815, partial [Homarus americanus]|uniref:uncharacterized protein LOC121857815 n=1 Tax=Homarus americanus TaxID=6706 RepID=UPI001C44839C
MQHSEIFFPVDKAKDFARRYGSLDEPGVHPLVHKIIEEEDEFLPYSSPSSSPRFTRRGNRRELKKFRESTCRRTPLRGPGSWSPEMTRPVFLRSTCHDSEACEEGAVVPSAPPMEHMDHFTGYEQLSFEAVSVPPPNG